MWVPARMYKIKGGSCLRTPFIDGAARIPTALGQPLEFVGTPLTEGMDGRYFISSAIVETKTLADGAGILFRTRNGSEYLVEKLWVEEDEPVKYRVQDDPWIDLGGEG